MSFHRRVDFDIHRLIGIRLVDPPIAAEAVLRESMGLRDAYLDREPDLTIRFVSSVQHAGLRFLGQGQHAFSEGHFFILHRRPKGTMTRIPFDRLGDPCEITTDSGRLDVGLLLDLIKLIALKKQHAPVHGSALIFGGKPILFSSWAKGGKTTALLGFIGMGGDFVGDDCILLSGPRERMFGIPSPLEITPRHLNAIPLLHSRITFAQRARIVAMRSIQMAKTVLDSLQSPDSTAGQVTQKGIAHLQNRLKIRVSPFQAFGPAARLQAGAPRKVFILISHQDKKVVVEPVSIQRAVQHLTRAALEDQKALREHYFAFRYAFPNRPNPVFENGPEMLQQTLFHALSNTDAFEVRHPYPIQFADFYSAIRLCCEQKAVIRTEVLSPAGNECPAADVVG